MMAAALVIVVLYIPESLPPEDKIDFHWSVFKNPFKPQVRSSPYLPLDQGMDDGVEKNGP